MNQTAYLHGINSVADQQIAYYLLERGLKVVTSFANKTKEETFLSSIPEHWQKHCILVDFFDMHDASAIEKQVTSIATAHKTIDLYIHASQRHDEQRLLESHPEQFYVQLEEQMRTLFLHCQAIGRIMTKQKSGQIIIPLLSDVLYHSGFPSAPIYNQGAIAFVKSYAKELSLFNVSINAFEIGYYKKNNAQTLTRKEKKQFEIYALKPPIPSLEDALKGMGMLLDYGSGMSGQVIQWGYGMPATTT